MSTRGPADDDSVGDTDSEADGDTVRSLEQTRDDTSLGWGDESDAQAEAERDAWYLAERPPHHEG